MTRIERAVECKVAPYAYFVDEDANLWGQKTKVPINQLMDTPVYIGSFSFLTRQNSRTRQKLARAFNYKIANLFHAFFQNLWLYVF